MDTKRAEQVLDVTLTGLRGSLLKHMPACRYRDFSLWALSAQNPHRRSWLDVIGIRQTNCLTVEMLDGIVEDRHWPPLARYTVPLNVYLSYEVVSDNLAIGLANQSLSDKTYAARRDLIQGFNHSMIQRLGGDHEPAARRLQPLQRLATEISGFEQSLQPNHYRTVAREYVNQRPGCSLDDLEYAVWPILVANIEAGNELVRSVSGFHVGSLVQQGLVSRYRAVNGLLEDNVILPRRAHVGADAVLAMPVLAYYAGVLGETIWRRGSFQGLVADGTLSEALFSAAILVRLVNDLGTGLVTQTDEQRSKFVAALKSHYWQHHPSARTLAELLLKPEDEFRPLLTRIRKDLLNGEFNVCLYGFSDTLPVSYALVAFEQRLAYLSQLYLQCRVRFTAALEAISQRLDNGGLSLLMSRFVRFHEALYGQFADEAVDTCAI
jgi:hypothetical protein